MEAPAQNSRPALIVVTGIVGTGKSTVAERIADLVGGAVVSSDRVRKHLAGLDPLEPAPAAVDRGIYTSEHARRAYEGLLERAQPIVASGRIAILDATYSREEQRTAASQFGRSRNLPFLIVETRCPKEVVLHRLAERQRAGTDPSDAGPSPYEQSVARFARVKPPYGAGHVVIDTDSPSWSEELERLVGDWHGKVRG